MSKDNSKRDDVTKARDLLGQFIELQSKPSVRNDPVIKAMVRGMLPASSPFETASMAVATLRNAGCLDADTKSSAVSQTGANDTKKAEKKKKEGTSPADKPAQKLRGFDRSVDVLLEDAVFRKEYPDKESHPLAIALRKLRENPDREVKIQRFEALSESIELPNGKTRVVFKGIKKDDKGKPLLEPVKPTPVKSVNDIDLLATESEEGLVLFMEEYKNSLFSWADKASVKIPGDAESVWPSLKGTETLELIKAGEASKASLITALNAEKFSRFGPSPTLYFKDYLKYVLKA